VTGTDGRATAIFTAPSPTPSTSNQIFVVTILATPTGSNAQTLTSRTAEIRLVPTGVILPPPDTPTANFTFPTPATAGTSVTFDGSTSCAGPAIAGSCEATTSTISSYVWNFGDGSAGSGSVVGHTYTVPGTYLVTLTVTNNRGRAASTTKSVTVSAAQAPSGDWVISPTAPNVNETVFFNADGVRASAGHTISSYNWDFGDGTTATGVHTSHVYTAARTYAVVLNVTDDTGATAVISKNITIGSGSPNAVLTVTKTGGNDIRADGGSSSAAAGSSISTYTFDFGSCNATGQSGSQSFATRTCAVGTHTIRLTVTDSAGRSSSTTQSVTVP
jgi:PKD repeat protein